MKHFINKLVRPVHTNHIIPALTIPADSKIKYYNLDFILTNEFGGRLVIYL